MSVKTVNLGSEVLSSSGISKFYIFWIELKNCRTKDSADFGTVLRVPDCFVHYQLLSNAQCKISQLTS